MKNKKDKNVVHFVNINKGIEFALNTLGLRANPADICFVRSIICVQTILDFVNTHPDLLIEHPSEGISIERLSNLVIEEIHKRNPNLILPSNFYFHELLEEESIELICSKLKRYELKAKKSVIQQLAWNVMYIFYSKDDIESWEHAANIVIKVFRTGKWRTPRNCPDVFKDKQALEDLM